MLKHKNEYKKMSKIDKLKKARIDAMKAKDVVAKGILSYLQSEVQAVAKQELRDFTDEDITEVAKALIKKNQSLIDLGAENYTELKKENSILSEYAPQKFDEAKLYSIINDIIDNLVDEDKGNGMIKKIMPALNQYGDMVDKRIASQYINKKSADIEEAKTK